jgi:hypothetical protein
MNDEEFVRRFLEKGRELYNAGAGDKRELLHCMYWCTKNRISPPQWLEDAFCEAWQAVVFSDEKVAWEDVFGKPFPKGKHRGTAERNRAVAGRVFDEVEAMAANNPKDEALWEKVSKKLKKELKLKKFGGSTVRDLYYDVLKEMDGDIAEQVINRK